MALRHYLVVFCLVMLVTLGDSSRMENVMFRRLNALETKFETENKLRRSEIEELLRMFSELAEYRATDLLADHHKLKSYITKGVAVEKQENAELRSELEGISTQLIADYAMFVSRIRDEINKLTNDVSDKLKLLVSEERFNNLSDFVTTSNSGLRNEVRQSMISLKSDVETTIHKLSSDLKTVNQTAMENIERCNNVNDSLIIVTNERLNNISAFVSKTQSELRNKARQSLISLKSDVETSIQKLAYDLQTVNQTTTEHFERCNNVSDSLSIVTNERLNNLTALVNMTHSELRNETRQSMISLKNVVGTSFQRLSNDFQTMNQTAMENVERCNNVSESLAKVTNERLNNLNAFVTTTQSELRNETRQSMISIKSDVEISIQRLSNDFHTVNQTAVENVERCNNVIDSLTIVTNKRLVNLSAYHHNLKTYITQGVAVEKQQNVKLRLEIKSISKQLEANYTMFESRIKEEMRNFTDKLTLLVSEERINNLSDFVTTTQSELRNEARQSLISLESDVEASIQKLSNDFRSVNQTTIINGELCNNVSDSLKIVTSDLHTVNTFLKMMYLKSCRNAPKSGTYVMYNAKLATTLPVYCDQETDGGGWLLIQRRKDGSVDFERTWADYMTGFGDIENEFWIGNDNIHALTSSGLNELRIDMEDFEGNKAYAKYSNFKVHPEMELYRLEIGGYSGNAGDSLTPGHNRMAFSTIDRDNDEAIYSCSKLCRGAWWYFDCVLSNLNGRYYHGGKSPDLNGIFWYDWKGYYYSLKTVEMKIR